jgi:hypothetical protein
VVAVRAQRELLEGLHRGTPIAVRCEDRPARQNHNRPCEQE